MLHPQRSKCIMGQDNTHMYTKIPICPRILSRIFTYIHWQGELLKPLIELFHCDIFTAGRKRKRSKTWVKKKRRKIGPSLLIAAPPPPPPTPGPPNILMFSHMKNLLSSVFPCCTYISNVMKSSGHFSTSGFNMRFPRTPPPPQKQVLQITSIFYMLLRV